MRGKAVKVIGLTGGAGAGKSAVGGLLAQKGILYLSSDILAREVVAPGQPALAEIVEAFGPGMVEQGGTLDRARMGELIFTDAQARKHLENIIHPRVIARIREIIASAREEGMYLAVVVEVPLLFESGAETMMDEVWVVDADEDTQVERMARRDGIPAELAWERLRAQIDPGERINRADILIPNTGSEEDLAKAVDQAWADALARWANE